MVGYCSVVNLGWEVMVNWVWWVCWWLEEEGL